MGQQVNAKGQSSLLYIHTGNHNLNKVKYFMYTNIYTMCIWMMNFIIEFKDSILQLEKNKWQKFTVGVTRRQITYC